MVEPAEAAEAGDATLRSGLAARARRGRTMNERDIAVMLEPLVTIETAAEMRNFDGSPTPILSDCRMGTCDQRRP